eukprot:Em0012g428a
MAEIEENMSKKYPECVSETKKRVIRRKAAKLTISVEGELLYKHKQGKEKQEVLLRYIQSLEERQKILLTCHIDSTSGHMVKAPWYMVGIDFIGPLSPVAKDGSRYILTISDYFTKWVEVIFMRMGLPRVLLSDNGSEFCNALNDQLSEMLGIKRRLTTPYHPQANGLDERFNQTLQNMLVKYLSSKKDMWSHYLDTCAFAYNTSRHDSTKYTPFMLMFGRRATLPIDVELERQCSEDLCKTYWELEEHPYPAVFSEHARILEEAKGNIIAAQLRQKETYDKKHCKPGQFQCNQLVLLRNFSRKKVKGGKLTERFLGPYTIINVLQNGVYEIRNEEGKTTRATGSHLKMLLLLVLWQALILLKMIQIVTKEANLKTIHHPVIVPIKMTVLMSVALTVVALYWRIVQFLLNEIPFSTLLAQNNGYLPAKMDAIQIHIVSDSHWVTSARLGGTVTLCDCPVNVATVQKQRGSDWVFAIAFALHAALGHCLEEIEFDQATMRDHLFKCYTTRNFTPFLIVRLSK